MTLSIIDTPHTHAADRMALAAAKQAREQGFAPIVVAPTYDETVRIKKKWASEGSFGIAVETMQSWIADMWELLGDGRALVSPVQREFLVGESLALYCAERDNSLLSPSPGLRKFIASIAREALPFAADAPQLGEGEREAVAVLGIYRERLADRGLVEQAEAAFALAESDALERYRPLVVGTSPDELSAVERKLLDAAEGVVFENRREVPDGIGRAPELEQLLGALYAPDEEHPVEAAGSVRFVLPTGRYAAPGALADAVGEALEANPSACVAVAARDAHATFAELAPRLAERGIPVCAKGAVSFAATEFGSAWLALLDTVFGDGSLLARTATDFALSAYSGMGVRGAYWLDARWRANRAVDRDAILTDLSGTADFGLNGVVGSVECGRMDDAFDILQAHLVRQASWAEGYRDRQLSALSLARSVFDAARELGVGVQEYRSVLEDQRMYVSVGAGLGLDARGGAAGCDDAECGVPGASCSSSVPHPAPERPPVLVVDLDGAASLEACSVDVLVIADLSAAAYPVHDDDDARSRLLDKLGAKVSADGLASLRRTFYDAVCVPRQTLVISRLLNTVTADEERPAVIFEDVTDCYRTDLQDPSEIDKATGLPAPLVPYVSTRSEGGAYANLSPGAASQPAVVEIPVFPTGHVTANARGKILLPQQRGGVVCEGYSLSPSAIESYLECPYKWFAHRRLRLESLDAGFGGREFGLFAHKVLEQFYERFRIEVAPKVTPDALPHARQLLVSVFDDRLAYEATLIGEPTALVPLNDLERKEVDDLKRKLLDYLEREARLLPGFEPIDGEVSFGCKRGDFEYAGFKVNGTIDRVDVDGFGRAVVIDYKGAVGKAYALRDPKAGRLADVPIELPRKVQTLIYAQAVRRTMGLEPVGALYLSYGKDRGIAGAFDHTVLDPEKDLLGIDADLCGATDFCDLLDRVEETVAVRLRDLVAGEIPARPRDEDACTYCPVTVCSARDAMARKSGGDE